MDQETVDTGGVTRGQNVVYVLPYDLASVAHFLGPALDRLDPAVNDVQMLVVTPDVDTAAGVTGAAVRLADARQLRVLPATDARRAARLVRDRSPQIIAGPAETLLSLVEGAVLKTDGLRAVALAWIDATPGSEGLRRVETLVADVPKSAARIVVAAVLTSEVEDLIERYARRARRVVPPAADEAPIAIRYVATSSIGRAGALRRVLDLLDPRLAAVFVRTDESERMASDALATLGATDDAAPVRITRTTAPDGTDVVVLFDLPATHHELRMVAGPDPRTIVAFAHPRQLSALRALAGGGTVAPITLPAAAETARSRDDVLRAEVRRELEANRHGREVLALESLLEDFDGIEIAGAVVRLLERARAEQAASAAAAARTTAATPSSSAMTKLFINVGSKDNARPADLVGAIANEAGIDRTQIGRIDLRETYSLVEVDTRVARDVATKITGSTIRGRRVQARLEEDRPPRRDGDAGRGDRRPPRPRGGDAGGRGDRGGPRRSHGNASDRRPRAARPPRDVE